MGGRAVWLWALTGLFVLRVAAQIVQAVAPIASLPAFDAWQSGTLPYPVLLAAQLVIIVAMVHVARTHGHRISATQVQRRWGPTLLALGCLYAGSMIARLAIGLTVAPEHPFFGKLIPGIFHLVLAAFVLSVARIRLDAPHGAAHPP